MNLSKRKLEAVIKDELIGREICAQYLEKEFVGEIIDETKQMIRIRTKKKDVCLPKAQIKLKMEYEGNRLIINGKRLIGRPADRIKKKIKRKW